MTNNSISNLPISMQGVQLAAVCETHAEHFATTDYTRPQLARYVARMNLHLQRFGLSITNRTTSKRVAAQLREVHRHLFAHLVVVARPVYGEKSSAHVTECIAAVPEVKRAPSYYWHLPEAR